MKKEIVETDDGPMEQITMDGGKTVILKPVSGNGDEAPPPPEEAETKAKLKKGNK